MFDKIDYYKTTYDEIEDEIISLTKNILFCDEQMSVYSSKLANLILRCGAEIETLFKNIYQQGISEKLPDSIGECVKAIDKKYLLDKKKVRISNTGIFFEKQENLLFCPFSKENYFYDSYCALKHDLGKNISKANIKTLLMATAAMFILVLYYESLFVSFPLIEIHDYNGMLVKSKIFRLPLACISLGSLTPLTIDGMPEKNFKELEICASLILIYNGESPKEFQLIKEQVLKYNFSLTGDAIPLGTDVMEYITKNFTNGDEQASAFMITQIYGTPSLEYKYRIVNTFGEINADTLASIKKKLLYYKFGLVETRS